MHLNLGDRPADQTVNAQARQDRTKFHRVHAQLEVLGCLSEFVVIAGTSRTVLDVITEEDKASVHSFHSPMSVWGAPPAGTKFRCRPAARVGKSANPPQIDVGNSEGPNA